MKLFRSAVFAFSLAALPASALLVATDASASVSIAVGYEALLKDADAVGVVTPLESSSVWEGGRIYTYTKVRVDQPVAGDVGTGSEAWIRTMGGVVDKIGQMVEGEAVLTAGKPSLLFLRKWKAGGTWEVSARAQGQYPIVTDDVTKVKKAIRSANAGMLLPPKDAAQTGSATTQSTDPAITLAKARLAQEVMHDRALDDVTRDIASSWKKLHPAASTSGK